MRLKYILISFCLLLSSCGKWQWIGTNKPSRPLEQDIIYCRNQATKTFPSKTYYKRIVLRDASVTNDGSRGFTIRPTEQIDIQPQDANQEDRDLAFKKCMLEQGWRLEY